MRDIKGYEGKYAVTSCGRVWSYKSKKFLIPHDNGGGYMIIDLCKNGVRKHHYAHRLVAQAYLPNPDNLPQVNHKDECTTHNYLNNLEWCAADYNHDYGTRAKRQAQKISKPVYCTELDKTFKSLSEAAKHLNISPGYVSYALNNPNKSKGYHFRYV